jgi:hypothetical protein
MQQIDLSKFKNTANWKVKQNPDTGMYEVFSERGNRLPSVFTHRKFAEAALAEYLERIETTARFQRKQKELQEGAAA